MFYFYFNRDDLFHSINGQRGERYMFESLCPGEFLFSGTIDCFVEVLNYDERARNLDTPSCFFFKTAVLVRIVIVSYCFYIIMMLIELLFCI